MFIFSNLAISLDGKIATTARGHTAFGTRADFAQMMVLRRRSDAIVMGSSTLRVLRKFCSTPGKKLQPANVIIGRGFKGIEPDWPFFQEKGVRRILIHTKPLSQKKKRAFAKTCDLIYIKQSSEKEQGKKIVKCLAKQGFKKVLVEGGGEVMWTFAAKNLIDEYNVTITPKIVGGKNAPTLVDGIGHGPKELLNLKLSRVKRLGNELYLVYRKTAQRGPLA
jgi:riboflavin-specific deaminase-like protein